MFVLKEFPLKFFVKFIAIFWSHSNPLELNHYNDLLFYNDNGFNFLISCCEKENKIILFEKKKKEKN